MSNLPRHAVLAVLLSELCACAAELRDPDGAFTEVQDSLSPAAAQSEEPAGRGAAAGHLGEGGGGTVEPDSGMARAGSGPRERGGSSNGSGSDKGESGSDTSQGRGGANEADHDATEADDDGTEADDDATEADDDAVDASGPESPDAGLPAPIATAPRCPPPTPAACQRSPIEIFQSDSCAGVLCHGTATDAPLAYLDLAFSVSGLAARLADTDSVFCPGEKIFDVAAPAQSLLVRKLRYPDADVNCGDAMPPPSNEASFTSEDAACLLAWLEAEAPCL